ncbi:3-methylornithyl-N6-L-lysine dehydrogenase PylD [Desulfosporosinus youngiae]|uniref:Pyrrolysine biosynthesis protein PylD n=1 Tax=Desulfosporosinus youngiae DSM 17734 TaxID=768710 RepID=H5Y373_9FIRM|nr:3-methylornithyl-N6-L-lysine dehydrogenase PylD [Desulfosporosinus youngiae]EHQ88768.1 pyrrolysine biosynthesis protein PylD [Desulfosporosinus youngiae DSM 17734]
MTRLKEKDVNQITAALGDYNEELVRTTGCSLNEIAALASGKEIDCPDKQNPLVAVIPMTCGQGIIEGFVESVAGIIAYLGFQAVVTKNSDAGGVAEAVKKGADILFMADDDQFVAINIRTGKVSDNGEATGKGYVTGLECMCHGLEGKKVLLLGAGPVGSSAALALVRKGAVVSVFDINIAASQRLSGVIEGLGFSVNIVTDLESSLAGHQIFVDACPAEKVIDSRYITKDTMIAAPGIPLGVQAEGLKQRLTDRLLHDPLQIGVATMLWEVFESQKL